MVLASFVQDLQFFLSDGYPFEKLVDFDLQATCSICQAFIVLISNICDGVFVVKC